MDERLRVYLALIVSLPKTAPFCFSWRVFSYDRVKSVDGKKKMKKKNVILYKAFIINGKDCYITSCGMLNNKKLKILLLCFYFIMQFIK